LARRGYQDGRLLLVLPVDNCGNVWIEGPRADSAKENNATPDCSSAISRQQGSRHGYFYVYSYNWEVDRQYLSFIRDSELLSRGWVFQEWLLSRRILYFTPAGIFFECEERPPYNDRGEISQTISDDDIPAEVQPSAKNSFI
jgi:hypothetical protein